MTTPMPHAHHHYAYEEYLAYERDSELKHEFDGGEIFDVARWMQRSTRRRNGVRSFWEE